MEAVSVRVPMAAEPPEEWRTSYALPELDLTPLTARQLSSWFEGGEVQADVCERVLATAARACGSMYVAMAEGLHAIRQGSRLARLGCHFDDYAREALDLGKSAAEGLARLGGALRTRPLLRAAMISGRVKHRAGEIVWPVAVGEKEPEWVERAAGLTVRELEAAVRRAKKGEEEPEEDWFHRGLDARHEERAALDVVLARAGEALPGSSRMERLEAMAQEFLGTFPVESVPVESEKDDGRLLDRTFRALGPGREPRRAALEKETGRWSHLPSVADLPAPDVGFYDGASAEELDARLRELARLQSRWAEVLGHCAHAVKASRLHERHGFADFRQYVEERLGLPPRAVEQRAALEERIWKSPALQEARRQKLAYEKLRLLARLREEEIASWTPRAHALTCIELKRRLEGEKDRQMRESGRIRLSLPRRIALVVAMAIQAVRERVRGVLSVAQCLVLIGKHFVDTWREASKGSKSRSRRIRERDKGQCQAPGCSHRATHSHHIVHRSRGGGDEPENLVALCAFHHLRCIHGGWLRVFGRAPAQLTWFRAGKLWRGPGEAPLDA